jgi:GT2 family glycosyltransferase
VISVAEGLALGRQAWRDYRLRGAAPLIARIGRMGGHLLARLERPSGALPAGVTSRGPRHIRMKVSGPARGAVIGTESLTVAGWSCSADGVSTVEVFVDGTRVGSVEPSLPRPDLARRFASIPQAAESGFSLDVSLRDVPHGPHRVLVVARDRAGHCQVIQRSVQVLPAASAYRVWVMTHPARRAAALRARVRLARAGSPPVQVWLDARDSSQGIDLEQTIRSLAGQGRVRWRCTLVADRGSWAEVEAALDRAAGTQFRRRFRLADSITPRTTASYGLVLRSGEQLLPTALARLILAAHDRGADIAYADHDVTDADGNRSAPTFAPDWSPIHELGQDYVGGVFLVRLGRAVRAWIEDPASTSGLAWRYALLLTAAVAPAKVVHVPRVLWSAPANPTGPEEEAQQDAVVAYLERREPGATVVASGLPGIRRLTWPLPHPPRVSMVIPTTCRLDLVQTCIGSLSRNTDYPDYELVFLDNGRGRNEDGRAFLLESGHRVVERDEPFNWARLSNAGAAEAHGELLLFLNDDIEAFESGWLRELASLAIRPDSGSVGGLLLYPNGLIQHAGVLLVGYGGGAMHWFQRQDPEGGIYRNLHAVTREVAANTGACLMVRRDRFEAIGGFDETLAISGNDIDFCLRLSAQGYRNLWTPHARLVHHESVSRRATPVEDDESAIWRRWRTVLRAGDSNYNPNFSREASDCSLSVEGIRTSRAARQLAGHR